MGPYGEVTYAWIIGHGPLWRGYVCMDNRPWALMERLHMHGYGPLWRGWPFSEVVSFQLAVVESVVLIYLKGGRTWLRTWLRALKE